MTEVGQAEVGARLRDQYEHQGRPVYSTARLWDDGVMSPPRTPPPPPPPRGLPHVAVAAAGPPPACALDGADGRAAVGVPLDAVALLERVGHGLSLSGDLAAPAVGAARGLDELLEALEVALDAALGAWIAAPTFSLTPSGTKSICTMTRELSSVSLWNVTTPALSLPSVLRQATRSSGCCSVISASHSWRGTADLGHPVQVAVVELADLLDALHELRELLEPGPLVVCRADRDVEVDGLLDGGGRGLAGPVG